MRLSATPAIAKATRSSVSTVGIFIADVRGTIRRECIVPTILMSPSHVIAWRANDRYLDDEINRASSKFSDRVKRE